MPENGTVQTAESATRAPAVPFHIGLLAEVKKEKIKTELLCVLLGLIALTALGSAIVSGTKGTEIVALDSRGGPVKFQKLGPSEYLDAHIQSFAMDFITFYFDKDPLSVKGMTEKALGMMTQQLREKESAPAVTLLYNVVQSNTRVVNEVRSMELDPQDRFTIHVIAERTTRTVLKGSETEKKEIVKYRFKLAPERRAIENAFKGLRVREYHVEVI